MKGTCTTPNEPCKRRASCEKADRVNCTSFIVPEQGPPHIDNERAASVILFDSVTGETINRLEAADRKTAVALAKMMLAEYQEADDRIAWYHTQGNNEAGHLPNVAYLINRLDGESASDFQVHLKLREDR